MNKKSTLRSVANDYLTHPKSKMGITLIALVITIIVLLILAGISIAMLSGDNGILQKATSAKEQTEIVQEKEIVTLAYNSALTKKISNGDSTPVTSEDMNVELTNQGATATGSSPIKVTFTDSKRQYTINSGIVDYAGIKNNDSSGDGLEGLSNEEVALLPTGVVEKSIENISNENLKDVTKIKAVITDSDNGEVPIPKGANYKEGTESTGLVIEYKGSEFVWVPINSNLTVKGTNKVMAKVSTAEGFAGVDSNGKTNYEGVFYDFGVYNYGWQAYDTSRETTNVGQGTNERREPDVGNDTVEDLEAINLTQETFMTEMQENYNQMIESVSKYGGFFVGRYETCLNNSTIVASKSGETPMTNCTSGYQWYGMYDKQKKFTTSSDLMQSSMIWGSQFDAMLNWIQTGEEEDKINIGTLGNHTDNLKNAGETSGDCINNIYDLAGNLREFTLEAIYDRQRVYYGSYWYFQDYLPVAYKYWQCTNENFVLNNSTARWGSRMSLFIK